MDKLNKSAQTELVTMVEAIGFAEAWGRVQGHAELSLEAKQQVFGALTELRLSQLTAEGTELVALADGLAELAQLIRSGLAQPADQAGTGSVDGAPGTGVAKSVDWPLDLGGPTPMVKHAGVTTRFHVPGPGLGVEISA